MADIQAISDSSDSYDARYFEPLFAIEDRHFWFRSRNLVIAKLVRHVVKHFQPEYRVLEIGCGTGNTLRVLEQVCTPGTVLGMDLFHEGLKYARYRVSCPLVQGDMHFPPFRTQFDLIGFFDVLEHLPDDMKVLHDLLDMLKPNGYLMLTVPAHRSLWSYFDEASHHYRRYEYDELGNKLAQTGYHIEFLTQYMASIFPLVWVGRRLSARFPQRSAEDEEHVHDLASRELRITPVLNDLLFFVLSLEAQWVIRHHALPIGTSLLAVVRKEAVSSQRMVRIFD